MNRSLPRRFGSTRTADPRQRGVVSVLFLFTIFALVGTIALTLNIGATSVSKMRVQLAADSTAYAAAAWNARATNLVTLSNMAIVRTASAEAIALAASASIAEIGVNLAQWSRFTWLPIVGWAIAAKILQESLDTANFARKTFPGIRRIFGGYSGDINEIFRFQQNLVASTPRVVQSQADEIADYYGVLLSLHTGRRPQREPNDGQHHLGPPVKEPTGLDFTAYGMRLVDRVVKDRRGWHDDGLFNRINLGSMPPGRMITSWKRSWQFWRAVRNNRRTFNRGKSLTFHANWNRNALLGAVVPAARYANKNHVLVSQVGPSETGSLGAVLNQLTNEFTFRVGETDKREHFGYVVLAVDGTPPVQLMPRLIFTGPRPSPTAYAQAQVYNGQEGLPSFLFETAGAASRAWNSGFSSARSGSMPRELLGSRNSPIIGQIGGVMGDRIMPWRVWTTRGAHWMPRLVPADSLPDAIRNDPRVADFFIEHAGLNTRQRELDELLLH